VNYYERYVGNYGKKTAHLTLAQHGAYTLMLDTYYANEKPLAADFPTLYRICRAMDKGEQAAVRAVADEFFPVGPDGLRHNEMADEVIPKALKRIESGRANGKLGGRPKKSKTKPEENPAGSDPVSPEEPSENPAAKLSMHHAPINPIGGALSPNTPGESDLRELPGNLQRETWADWQRHLLQKGKRLSEPQLRMQLAALVHVPDADEHVRRCVRMGYVALEPPGRVTTATQGNGRADRRAAFTEQIHGATKGPSDEHERDITGESKRVA
jgi:uncharacterized protein YdaU (DUF1376 family)